MFTKILRFALCLLLLCSLDYVKCNFEQQAAKLLQALKSKSRRSSDFEEASLIWQDYEFGTGAGNREELVVQNISVREYSELPESQMNWQFLEANGSAYLAGAVESTLSLYKLNFEKASIDDPINLRIEGRILTFKLFDYKSSEEIDGEVLLVLCVESEHGTSLQWYKVSFDTFENFWSWPVQKHVRDLEFVRYGNQSTLLLLDNDETYFGKQYSPIDIYSFTIDFTYNNFHFWLCQRIIVLKTLDIQVCPNQENTMLAFQGLDNVLLYEHKSSNTVGLFEQFQVIKSHGLRNFVCFESGYIQYLAMSGPEAGVFQLHENEFQYNTMSGQFIDEVPEIAWVKDIRMDTYRDESLLLMQLKNSTVIALAWQGAGFRKITLPNSILDQFDLSRAIAIPKFGFVSGNKLVRIATKLEEAAHQNQKKTEMMLKTKILLQEVLQKQESIIDETEKLINKSYLKNPVITGTWNLSEVNAENVTIKDKVIYHAGTTDSKNVTADSTRAEVTPKTLQSLKEKLKEIQQNIDTRNSNSTDINLEEDIEITGSLNILGTLSVHNVTANYINDVPISHVSRKLDDDDLIIIDDQKTFSSIQGGDLKVLSLNGIPVKDIFFDDSKKNYNHINFSQIKQLVIVGDLNFSAINDVNWEMLMQSVVWKNRDSFIDGNIVIDEIVADEIELNKLNNLEYPDDYILTDNTDFANVTGLKIFEKLTIQNLLGINTINDINIDDYIILNKNVILNEEITFENLTIDGSLQIDGNITGLNTSQTAPVKLLNETNSLSSRIIFSNLVVIGDVLLENSIDDKNWFQFDDLILTSDERAEITGSKTFLNDVEVNSEVVIQEGVINDHPIQEFLTLDTDQELPNLEKISANVSFGQTTLGIVKKLEESIKSSYRQSNCSENVVLFTDPLIVDGLSFDDLNTNTSEEVFLAKLNRTFREIYFENLTATTLFAQEITPRFMNGINFTDFEKRRLTLSTPQNLTGNYRIRNLETELLDVKFINKFTLDEIDSLENQFDEMYREIFAGNATIEDLNVTGTITAASINGMLFEEIYKPDRMGNVIFESDVSIEKLTVLGSINDRNFSDYVFDTVLKTDTNITVTGYKKFENINSRILETSYLNGHPVENILDVEKEQTLKGPVTIKGLVTVLKHFDAYGKIDNIPFKDVMHRFRDLRNNTFDLHGDFKCMNDTSIKNLNIHGFIQGVVFDEFLDRVIYKNDTNVTVSGSKVFENSVTFERPVTIHENLENLDLKTFYEKAVFIDKPVSLHSKIIFKDDLIVDKVLTVTSSLKANSTMNIDINELTREAMYLDKPIYISDPITFTNVTFLSNINVEKVNNIDMNLLIPLHTEQPITTKRLRCTDITVKNIEIMGSINGQNLKEIYEDTLMTIGDQNVTGNVVFTGNVYIRHDLNARSLNGISPKQIVSLTTNDTLTGNFVFEEPLVLNGSLRVLGSLNGLNPVAWQAVAVTSSFPLRQIVSGKWTVHGNVRFERNVLGHGLLNGFNVTELSDVLAESNFEIENLVEDIGKNLDSMCEDLSSLMVPAENQIYTFDTFEYLQIIDFSHDVVSVHHYELEDSDYLLVSYEPCHVDVFSYTRENFTLIDSIENFGSIDQWDTFKYKNVLYFLTVGKQTCGKNRGNLWKLENNTFTHVLDLGNVTDVKRMNDDSFLTLVNQNLEKRTLERLHEEPFKVSETQSLLDENAKFISNSDRILLSSRHSLYEYDDQYLNKTSWENCFECGLISSFKVGIYQKEIFLYYNDEISQDFIFVCDKDITRKRILQVIKAQKPSSFVVLNFAGCKETMLIFIENNKYIQLYEYQGIQGFVYKSTMKMEADKLFSLKIRKHHAMVKKQCLAVVCGSRLTILEAKMHGEKLDTETLSCSAH